MRRHETVRAGAAIGMALLEAASAHARPVVGDGVRLNTRNTPVAAGDLYQTGRGLLAAGDVTGAMAAFRQALLDAPQSVDALNGLGVCYDRLGRYDISRGYYESALAIEPHSPLVLNNLGYSLYLQGQYAAAIPVLQQAGAGTDSAVTAASQRVLALVAVRMRDAATRAAPEATVETATPRTRIETLSSGEQRLVFGAPEPDAALIAALGDDAVLVSVPRAGDAARADRRDDHSRRGEITLRDLTTTAAGDLPTVVYLSTSTPAAASSPRVTTVTIPTASVVAWAEPSAPQRSAAALLSSAAPAVRATPGLVRTVATAAPGRRSRTLPDRPIDDGRRDEESPLLAPLMGNASSRSREGSPAWLLSSRRSDRPTAGPPRSDSVPATSLAVAAFDSDVAELNAFAARMRGIIATTAPDPVAERDAAVARLEALIARIRAA